MRLDLHFTDALCNNTWNNLTVQVFETVPHLVICRYANLWNGSSGRSSRYGLSLTTRKISNYICNQCTRITSSAFFSLTFTPVSMVAKPLHILNSIHPLWKNTCTKTDSFGVDKVVFNIVLTDLDPLYTRNQQNCTVN